MSRARGAATAVVMFVLAAVIVTLLAPVVSADDRMVGPASSATHLPVMGNTLLLGVAQASLTLLLASLLVAVQTRDFRGRGLLHLACLTPLALPPFTMALALVVLFGHNGILTRMVPLPDVYGFPGLVAAGCLSTLPHAYVGLLMANQHVDQALLDQARVLGLSHWQARARVVWPRLAPSVATVWLMVFVEAITDVANPLVIGGHVDVLATRVAASVTAEDDARSAAAMALLLVLPSLMAAFCVRLLGGEWTPRALLAPRPRRREPLTRRDHLLLVPACGVMALHLLLVLVVVAGAVSTSIGVDPTPTWAHLQEVLVEHPGAWGHSVLLAALALPLTAVLALTLTPLAASEDGAGRMLRATLRMVGALPGVAVGLAAHLWLTPAQLRTAALHLEAMAVIVMVHVLRTVPGVCGALTAELCRVPQPSRDAARLLGASRWGQWRLATWPHLTRPLVTSLLLAFTRTLTAVSSVLLLTNSQTPLASTEALVHADAGRIGTACALAASLGVVALLAVATCLPFLTLEGSHDPA